MKFRSLIMPNTEGIFVHHRTVAYPVAKTVSPKTILETAIEVMTGREHKPFTKGIAAYDAWAKAILSDSEFPENAVLPFLAERLMCHGDAMNCLADGRYNAAAYLKSLMPSYPAYREQLKEAAALFEKVSGTACKMAKILGGWQRGENEMRTLAKPEVRKQLAEIIFAAKGADQKALEIVRELVAAL